MILIAFPKLQLIWNMYKIPSRPPFKMLIDKYAVAGKKYLLRCVLLLLDVKNKIK